VFAVGPGPILLSVTGVLDGRHFYTAAGAKDAPKMSKKGKKAAANGDAAGGDTRFSLAAVTAAFALLEQVWGAIWCPCSSTRYATPIGSSIACCRMHQ
jgi:hypothetical protein